LSMFASDDGANAHVLSARCCAFSVNHLISAVLLLMPLSYVKCE